MAPPPEVIAEFLFGLQGVVTDYDKLVPVLRGSTLMHRWFGSNARPAADVDLEWFAMPGWGGRYPTPLDHARTLCMFSLYEADDSPQIIFDEDIPVPPDGANLWEYGSPGARCYSGWGWGARASGGVLQIDIAQPNFYDLGSISTEFIELPRASTGFARVRAYTREMLLAAKLSWILRHTIVPSGASGVVRFTGEPKDVFDAYLLVAEGKLRPELFHYSLMAVAIEDQLSWSQLERFIDQNCDPILGGIFTLGPAFVEKHRELVQLGLDEMLCIVVQTCRELWCDFRQHVSFFQAVNNLPDEANILVYADWLEERTDPRSELLRRCCRVIFHRETKLEGLKTDLGKQSQAWVSHALGSTRQRLDALLK